jgi:uncharacterized damage-inducible protein DinB
MIMEQVSPAIDLRYPVGRFQAPAAITAEDRARFISVIERLPKSLSAAVAGLNDEQLDTPYREGGWTIRQVVHHLADSHMNSFIRFKLALTEESPTIKPYDEAACAELADSLRMPVNTSLMLLEGLHQRWTVLLRSMDQQHYQRAFKHPELGLVKLDVNLALYEWHCRHHTAHITSLRQRKGWN